MNIIQQLAHIDESLNKVIKVTEMSWRQGYSQYQQSITYKVIYIPELYEVEVIASPSGKAIGHVREVHWSKEDFAEFAKDFGAKGVPNFKSHDGDYVAWEVTVITNPMEELEALE